MTTSPREEDMGTSSLSDNNVCDGKESSANDPLRDGSPTKIALPQESDDACTAATNVVRPSFHRISFRQHETVIAVPQGGLSTVPSPCLGRVTEYTDHNSKSVDEYEQQRKGKRRTYTQLDCSPPQIRMPSSPRRKQRRQVLEAMRIKAMKQEDDDKEQNICASPRSPCKATSKSDGQSKGPSLGQKDKNIGNKPSSPFKESFGRFRSSLTGMSKQVAERLSVLFATPAADSGTSGKSPENDGAQRSPEPDP